MVTVVLLTTLLTPIIMRGAFAIHCPEDDDEDQRTREEPLTYARVAETTAEARSRNLRRISSSQRLRFSGRATWYISFAIWSKRAQRSSPMT